MNNDIATFKKFMAQVTKSSADPSFVMAAKSLEHAYFNNLLIALEGYFVHRVRAIELKDGNAMNEVRVISGSLMLNGGVMGTDSTIKMKPENTVLKIGVGEKI